MTLSRIGKVPSIRVMLVPFPAPDTTSERREKGREKNAYDCLCAESQSDGAEIAWLAKFVSCGALLGSKLTEL